MGFFAFDLFSSISDSISQVTAQASGVTVCSFPPIPAQTATNYDGGFTYDISLPTTSFIPSNASVYQGSLSAHGNMVAMQINPGPYKYIPSSDPTDVDSNGNLRSTMIPYLTGYLREYWRDPLMTTLGATSAIPAITGVMPARFVNTQGNAIYYIDLQMTRLSGSNFWNNYYFINVINKVVSWIDSTQTLTGVNQTLEDRIRYCGYKTVNEYITQGFSNYKIGNSLRGALTNIGILIQQITSGYFGTSNAVMKTLIDSGLGKVLNLFTKLNEKNVNVNDLYNPNYTLAITEILSSITDPSSLVVIQGVLQSTVPNMKSPMDYTDINACAGFGPNDSVFQSFITFGQDLFNKAPNFNVKTGKDFVSIINQISYPTTSYVLDAPTDALSDTLPTPQTGTQLKIQEVIGCATGYLTENLKIVNALLAQLRSSKYGISIHEALNNISKKYSQYKTELLQFNGWDSSSVPYSVNNLNSQIVYSQAITDYQNLLSQIASDPETSNLVTTINETWDLFCEKLSNEVINYNKMNLDTTKFDLQSNDLIYNFVTKSLKNLTLDSNQIDSYNFINQLCQPNSAGQTVTTLQDQYKNYSLLQSVGISIFDSLF